MQVSNFNLVLKSQPRAEGPELIKGGWTFQCLGLELGGSVLLGETPPPHTLTLAKEASRSPVGMGWRAGWIQVSVQEWYWALYRSPGGKAAWKLTGPGYEAVDNADREATDIFFKLDAPFYQLLGKSSPIANLVFWDYPIAAFEPIFVDPAGGRSTLESIGVRLSFVCALAARDPDDAVYVMKWVPWYVQWLCDFKPGAAELVPRPVAGKTKAVCGKERFGVPDILRRTLASSWGSKNANYHATFDTPALRELRGSQIDAELARLRALAD